MNSRRSLRDPWELLCTGAKRRKMMCTGKCGLHLVVGDAKAMGVLNLLNNSGAQGWNGQWNVYEAVCRRR